MPRTSKRFKILEQLQNTVKIRSIGRVVRSVECDNDNDDDSFEDAIDLASVVSLANVKKKCYLFRSSKY